MIKRLALAFLVTLVVVCPAMAKDPVFTTREGAIRGYDPVAYFSEGKPVQGLPEFSHEWNGAQWLFASADNLQRFKQDPERYAPQYGGYCAYAVANGSTATTEPEAWTIVDDRLYLNYSLGVRKTWVKDVPGNIKKADNNWPGVLN